MFFYVTRKNRTFKTYYFKMYKLVYNVPLPPITGANLHPVAKSGSANDRSKYQPFPSVEEVNVSG